MAEKEVVLRANPLKSVREAAVEAMDEFPLDQPDKHAKKLMEAWAARLKFDTDQFGKKASSIAARIAQEAKMGQSGVAKAATGPVTGVPPYPWWDIVIAGPFQTPPAPGGPFLPNKIFVPNEPAFCIGAVWLNPFPINWAPAGPSSAVVMNAFNLTINFSIINLVAVTAGPNPASVIMAPLGGWPFSPFPWLHLFFLPLGPGIFPMPLEGQPVLYEMNVTADVAGPVPGLPFAGFCTWVFDPDFEPATWPPAIPPVVPGWQYDIPMRFMTYRQ